MAAAIAEEIAASGAMAAVVVAAAEQ